MRGRGAAGRCGPRRRRRRGRSRPQAHPGAPGRSAPMPARPPCRSPRSGGGGERRWGVDGRGAGAMCERGWEAGGGAGSGRVRLQDQPGSRLGPGREPDGVRVWAGSGVQVSVRRPGTGAGSGSGCRSWPGSGLGLGSSPRAGFNPAPGASRSPRGGPGWKIGRVPCWRRGFEDHVGALKGALGHPPLWVKGHRTGGGELPPPWRSPFTS